MNSFGAGCARPLAYKSNPLLALTTLFKGWSPQSALLFYAGDEMRP